MYTVLSRQLNFNIHYHLKVIYFEKIRIVRIEKSNTNLWFIYAFCSVMYFDFFSIMPNLVFLLSLFKWFWLLGEQVKCRFGFSLLVYGFIFSALFEILVESIGFHYALLLVWYLWYSALSAWILSAIKGEEKGNFRCCWVPFQFSFSVVIFLFSNPVFIFCFQLNFCLAPILV